MILQHLILNTINVTLIVLFKVVVTNDHHSNNLKMNQITKLPVTILFAKHHFKHLPVNYILVMCNSNSAVWIMSRNFEF